MRATMNAIPNACPFRQRHGGDDRCAVDLDVRTEGWRVKRITRARSGNGLYDSILDSARVRAIRER
jgi:hypothetical protein